MIDNIGVIFYTLTLSFIFVAMLSILSLFVYALYARRKIRSNAVRLEMVSVLLKLKLLKPGELFWDA